MYMNVVIIFVFMILFFKELITAYSKYKTVLYFTFYIMGKNVVGIRQSTPAR